MRSTILALSLAAFAGCSSTPPRNETGTAETNADKLSEVATLLRSYPAKGGKGPTKASDLSPYEAGGPLGYAAIKSGEIVVIWGALMGGEGDSTSAEIIAYEKKTPTEGGAVLLLNGTVKTLTATEFAAAPKAAAKK